MVSYNIPVHAHVFVLTEGQLKEITIKRVFFDNRFGCDELQTEFRIEADRLKGCVRMSEIYDSVENYLRGIPCSNIIVHPFKEEVYEHKDHGANNGRGFYYIEDNQVKHLNVEEMPTAYYEYDEDRFYSDSFKGREFFPTREYASKFLEVEVNKADGTIVHECGINKLLMLDKDQRNLIKQLQGIVKKINDSGIFLFSDTDGEYYAYNTRNVEAVEVVGCGNEEPEGYELSGEFVQDFNIDLGIQLANYDDSVYAKRKK